MTTGVFKTIPSKDVKLHDKFYAHKSWTYTSGSISNDSIVIEKLSNGNYENEISRKYAMINAMFFEYSFDCYKTLEYTQSSVNNIEVTSLYQIGNKPYIQPDNIIRKYQPNSIRCIQSSVNTKNTLTPTIICISIPQSKIGIHIHYGSVTVKIKNINGEYETLIDNSHGELIYNGNTVGRIMYSAGIIIVYDTECNDINNILSVEWKSTVMLYQNHVLVRVKKDEFNVSMNPTLIDDSENDGIETGKLKSLVENDEFHPYVTTIGLYNDKGDLLVVARLSKPIPKRNDIDINFLIKWDY